MPKYMPAEAHCQGERGINAENMQAKTGYKGNQKNCPRLLDTNKFDNSIDILAKMVQYKIERIVNVLDDKYVRHLQQAI